MREIDVNWVKVTGRHRTDLGDLSELMESIQTIGLLHPITVLEDGSLLTGNRRLEAFRKLGRTSIPARVAFDLEGARLRLIAERDENTARKEMRPSELVSLGQALEALERPKARERIAEAGRSSGPGRRAESSDQAVGAFRGKNETRAVVAEALGMSPMSYYRARAVVEAAQDPESSAEHRAVAERALVEMDKTGSITPAYEKVRGRRPVDQPPGTRRSSQSGPERQRRVISNAVITLSGIAHGLKQIEELDPDLTSIEAAQWVDGLSEARGVISVLIKRLKERTNAAV